MIILECDQRTPEWYQARLGIPTASNFKRILTATGKASTSAETYLYELIGEWLTGASEDGYRNKWMERGTGYEQEALAWYELVEDREIQKVGFVYKDELQLVGCSPDGLMMDRGLEIKCPGAGVHAKYLLRDDMPTEYIPQVQGSMWVTEKERWDWLSYHPGAPPLVRTVFRDQSYMKLLDAAMKEFIDNLLEKREKLIKLGYGPRTWTSIPVDSESDSAVSSLINSF